MGLLAIGRLFGMFQFQWNCKNLQDMGVSQAKWHTFGNQKSIKEQAQHKNARLGIGITWFFNIWGIGLY